MLPETKGIPLEEVAALFGDQDEVVIFTEDLQLGNHDNEIVVKDHIPENEDDRNTKQAARPTHQEVISLTA